MIRKILVLCVGNICRSPMAQGLLRHAMPERSVRSAGLEAVAGAPADAHAIAVSSAAGIDISAHRSRQLDAEHFAWADLVLVMNDRQRRATKWLCPPASGKIFHIDDRSGRDVPDPFGAPYAEFERVFDLIRDSVQNWVPRIRACA
ncbi:low molecular weight protein-tyrosine-phosphatase [Cupriavidus pauculus]|uniref:protein-tyrosine-phosphatase n=1 Tax=Cupriavidus pauculus TaxID=82633 RepID=A0A2N5CCG3_9BURK|nr:low molecular weight protein-tyrosine-phosphatase [Cupriavidus pauculus]PLP99940.1 protein tyrosine phosphatase [Cupriavidus pauculus]